MIKMKVVAVLYLLTAAAVQVYTRPGGAPSGACANIFPVRHTDPPNSAPQPNPYNLYLNAFACPNGTAGYCYYPGATYQLTLSSSNGDVQYRGLLVQGRRQADMSPVGSFSDFTNTTQPSQCTPAESAVTHNSPVDKTCEVLTWTAPPNGTGPVVFQWAVVVRYSTGSVNMFYATLTTMMINEIDMQVMGEAPTCPTPPPPTTGTAATTAGATSLSGVGFWAILAIAVITAAKMVA